MTVRPEPRRISLMEFRDKIASGEIAIWCYCYDSPEPDGWWAPPDDEHADVCCLDRMVATESAARRPLQVNGKPIPPGIANGSPGDFARFCGETDPAVLALLDAEEEDVD